MLHPNRSRCHEKKQRIAVQENKSKYIANNLNRNTIYLYKIDGDIIPSSTSELRCDYLLENETNMDLYFIELKGTDLKHAIDQIYATIQRYQYIIQKYTVKPRIVYQSNTHAIQDSKVRKFRKQYKLSIIKTNYIEENI